MNSSEENKLLSHSQIQEYLEDGVLVVDNLLSPEDISRAWSGLKKTLRNHGVTSLELFDEESVRSFEKLSSTNGGGGVLDIFYDDWKMDIATNTKLFAMTRELWEAAYCHRGETKKDLAESEMFKWHPYGAFNCEEGFVYIDRIGCRIPTKLAEKTGDLIHQDRKKKFRALQRSLTPHLDCCPHSMYTDSPKWRPIQCFVSLSDSTEPDTGGFEAARGFHREFDAWVATRAPSKTNQKGKDGTKVQIEVQAACVGQYTHIRPNEDRDVIERVKHVPARAGSAVFWDNRIPHANAYRHLGKEPRVVVYCSFLPNVNLNREYMKNQLSDFRQGKPPRDQWNHIQDEFTLRADNEAYLENLPPLQRLLMGVDSWEGTQNGV